MIYGVKIRERFPVVSELEWQQTNKLTDIDNNIIKHINP